jgi:hypothetical protein
MFYYTPPPAVPVPNFVKEDCENNSRDCFPEDTVGGYIDDRSVPLSKPDLSLYSPLIKSFQPEAQPTEELTD